MFIGPSVGSSSSSFSPSKVSRMTPPVAICANGTPEDVTKRCTVLRSATESPFGWIIPDNGPRRDRVLTSSHRFGDWMGPLTQPGQCDVDPPPDYPQILEGSARARRPLNGWRLR